MKGAFDRRARSVPLAGARDVSGLHPGPAGASGRRPATSVGLEVHVRGHAVLRARAPRGSRLRSGGSAAAIALAWLAVLATTVAALEHGGAPRGQVVAYL